MKLGLRLKSSSSENIEKISILKAPFSLKLYTWKNPDKFDKFNENQKIKLKWSFGTHFIFYKKFRNDILKYIKFRDTLSKCIHLGEIIPVNDPLVVGILNLKAIKKIFRDAYLMITMRTWDNTTPEMILLTPWWYINLKTVENVFRVHYFVPRIHW